MVINALVSLSSTSMATATMKSFARTKETLATVPFVNVMLCLPKLMSKLKTFGTETITVSGAQTAVSITRMQTTAQQVPDQLICSAVQIVISLHLTCGIMLTSISVVQTDKLLNSVNPVKKTILS